MRHLTAMIAMGGNSLSPKGEAGTITQQFSHTRETLDGIGNFIERGYNLCINHGNGPQVGNELLRMDLTSSPFGRLCCWNSGYNRLYDTTIITKQIARYENRS